MLKFKPITYNEGDRRAFKYVGASDIHEGYVCAVGTGGSFEYQHVRVANTEASFAAAGTTTLEAGLLKGKFFPVWKEDPDIENVSATISQNDFVIGFPMIAGNEFEIHKTCLEGAYASIFTAYGQTVALGTNGKFTLYGGTNSTNIPLAQVTGTQVNWVRCRVL